MSLMNTFSNTAEQSKRQLNQLAFEPTEKVTVITDEVSLEIAAALVRELEELGCRYQTWVLEDVAKRPLSDLPLPIIDDLETSQVSIFAVQAQTNELKSRMQMTDVVNRRKIRHAHMVNINKRIMLEGMRADFQKVDRLSVKVLETVLKAKQIRATTPAGTNLVADLNPNYTAPCGLQDAYAFNATIDPGLQTPYNMTYNFGVQRQLDTATVVSATYVGSVNR